MNDYVFLVLMSILFYFLDKINYPCTNKKIDVRHEIIHVVHHFIAVCFTIGPFVVRDQIALMVLLFGYAFVIIQGATSKNRAQHCFLMPPYNRYCGIDENRNLYDTYSILNIDKTSDRYYFMVYGVHLSFFAYTLLKLQAA